MTHRIQRCVLVAFTAVTLASSSGCVALVAGAAAAGGATGYAYYKGRVTRVYVASPDAVWTATRTALTELKMPVRNEERRAGGGTIESSLGADRVEIALEVQKAAFPADGDVTRVGVRIGTFGDESASQRILDQISAHLVPAPAAGVPGPAPLLKPVAAVSPISQGAVPLTRPAESTPPPPLVPGKSP